MPLTSAQKALVAQFMYATGSNDKIAQRFLKNAQYKLDVAADAYFSSNPNLAAAASPNDAKLDKLFNDLRTSPQDGQDSLSTESVMKYAQNLGVSPEDAGIFVLMELVQAPSLGTITREGFVNGWKAVDATATKTGQKDYIQSSIRRLPHDPELFKRVYRYTFVAGKETPEQRAIPLENAVVYWQCMFALPPAPGRPWTSPLTGRNWLPLWTEYLVDTWKRTVSKDMWNQTLEFAVKSAQDPALGFWTPDGAWPSVIDDFVVWVKARNAAEPGCAANPMEVD